MLPQAIPHWQLINNALRAITDMALTYRESRYVKARLIQGASKAQALLAAGFSKHLADHPDFVVTEEMEAEVARLQAELVAHTLEAGLIDATEIHEYLTECLRADMRDIRNDDGSFKPQSQWPEIWGRMMEAGDCEIETLSERSHDGGTKDKRGGWDEAGTVTKVRLKFSSRTKLLELAMRHKGVNAMVEQKAGDVNIHLHEAVTAKLQAALAREQKVIELKAEESSGEDS